MRTVMKMASLSTITVFLLCCSVVVSTGDHCHIFAKTGNDVIVPLDQRLNLTDALKWRFENEKIFHKDGEKIVFANKRYVTTANGSLQLKNLKKTDEGTYTPEVYDNDKKLKPVHPKTLCVLDPVKKPTVKTECIEDKDSVKFTCKGDPNVIYEWYQDDKKLGNTETSLIKVAKEVRTQNFYCKVSNKVSSEKSNTVPRDSIEKCIKSTIPGIPDEVFGISIWIFIGGGAGIVLLLIIVVIVCCIRARRRQRMRLEDEEELRLGWTNPQQQRFQHSLPPPPDQQPPPQQQQRRQQHPANHNCPPGHADIAGHTGPRHNRSKQQRPRAPEPSTNQPQPSPRRAEQVPKPVNNADEEQPPPLPQPRKKRC